MTTIRTIISTEFKQELGRGGSLQNVIHGRVFYLQFSIKGEDEAFETSAFEGEMLPVEMVKRGMRKRIQWEEFRVRGLEIFVDVEEC